MVRVRSGLRLGLIFSFSLGYRISLYRYLADGAYTAVHAHKCTALAHRWTVWTPTLRTHTWVPKLGTRNTAYLFYVRYIKYVCLEHL